MRSFLFKKSANIEIAKYESDRQSVSESRMSNDKLASQLQKHSVLKVHLAPKVHFALKVHSALEVHAVKLSVMVGLPPPLPLLSGKNCKTNKLILRLFTGCLADNDDFDLS